MKRLLTILLLATLLLTACANPNPPIDNATTKASTGEESTTPADNDTTLPDDTDTSIPNDTDTTVPDDTETTTPEDSETTTPEDTDTCPYPGFIDDTELPGYFSNLSDFYTYVMTGSRDLASYIDKSIGINLLYYASVVPDALLKIEDLFGGMVSPDAVDEIGIDLSANGYCYYLINGNYIEIEYDSKRIPHSYVTKVDIDKSLKYVQEDEKNRFSADSEPDTVYMREVNGITIYRMAGYLGHYYSLETIIGNYRIRIVTGFEIIDGVDTPGAWNDPKYPHVNAILPFFEGSESELSNAVAKLIDCVNNKQAEH